LVCRNLTAFLRPRSRLLVSAGATLPLPGGAWAGVRHAGHDARGLCSRGRIDRCDTGEQHAEPLTGVELEAIASAPALDDGPGGAREVTLGSDPDSRPGGGHRHAGAPAQRLELGHVVRVHLRRLPTEGPVEHGELRLASSTLPAQQHTLGSAMSFD